MHALAASFRTDLNKGIYKDEESFERRQEKYGKNLFEQAPPKPFYRLCLDELQDPMLIILMIAGAVSIIAGTVEDPDHGWIEGFINVFFFYLFYSFLVINELKLWGI